MNGHDAPSDVVVSGLSGRLPECDTIEEFAHKLFAGVDLVTDDDRRWTPGMYGLPKRSGKLKDLVHFDAAFFGVHAKQAEVMDPQLRLLLEVTHETIVDAGLNPAELRGSRTGVYVGLTHSESFEAWSEDLDKINGYALTGCSSSMFPNRISFAFDLQGPSISMDVACASSMHALVQAMNDIRAGRCDAAVVAGTNVCLDPASSLNFHRLTMLSSDGRCAAFDDSGSGYVRSEAVVAVLLQRRQDARRVYCTVRGASTNNDGYKQDGISYPAGDMQRRIAQEAFEEAHLLPQDVTYVEAHGTGTKVGDPEEANAIAELFCKDRQTPLLMGSVKSNMGHSEPASGLCSIAKVVLAMERGLIPGNLHFQKPNTEIPALIDGRIKVPASEPERRMSSSATVTGAPSARMAEPRPGKHTVHWFRKGLRLHDNPALREGLKGAVTLRCVFIIDPWFATSFSVGINKWRFLLQCLDDLDSSLKKLNSRLFVVRGQPADALPKLFREWGTTVLTFEEDPEPYGRVRDHNIVSRCREVAGVSVLSRVSHTLFNLDEIIERNGGKAPLTYHQFQALIAGMPPPPAAETTITAQLFKGTVTPISSDHDVRFGVPTLEELGFETEGLKPPVWIGGESEALARLERHLERKAWVASFGRPKVTPQSLFASRTGLSPYLRFGCLSIRLFYYQLTELYKTIKQVQPPLSLYGQILWREFFFCAATRNPNFDQMEGNPICVQIPWEKNQDALAKWANGQTGYPWIDAIMIQLRDEGWIHHLARHAVACFLTRGDLWISWEEGMKVFEELLLDADWSVNAGTWMWFSCSSFFQQFSHCYCPVRFGRKLDPNGDFIRKYIPVLKNIPTQYIHEPWMAPEAVQVVAGCVVGRDYPLPMVDHNKASAVNIERIKQVYAQLAKYSPHGNVLNPNSVQRPDAVL